jgi:hypothetical protein
LSELTLYLWIIAEQENTEDRRRERHGGITQEEGRIIAQSQFDVNENLEDISYEKYFSRNESISLSFRMFVSLSRFTNSMMPLYTMYRLSSHEPDAWSVVKRLFQRSTTQLVVTMFFSHDDFINRSCGARNATRRTGS